MRIAIVLGLLALAACAQMEGPATKALAAYNACLDARGVAGCTVEKAKLDATLAYVDAASRATAANAVGPSSPIFRPFYLPQQPADQPSAPMIVTGPGNRTVMCVPVGSIIDCN